jgi:hypothetical protein
MGKAVGDTLPLALGVAISPVPVIAVILMLLSPRATGSGLGFLVGWVVGVVLVVTVVALLVGPAGSADPSGPSTTVSVVKALLGLVAVALAWHEWRGRPRPGHPASLPAWMSAIDSMTPVRATGLAALLAAVNPKNLTLCLAAGVSIGGAGLSTTDSVVVIAVFTVVASSTVAVPVIGYVAARDRMAKPLDDLRDWLTDNNATVMSLLLVVIGVVLLGQGLEGL